MVPVFILLFGAGIGVGILWGRSRSTARRASVKAGTGPSALQPHPPKEQEPQPSTVLLQLSRHAFVHVDTQERIDWANGAATELFKLPSTLPVAAEGFIPDYRNVASSAHSEVLKSPDCFDTVLRVVRVRDQGDDIDDTGAAGPGRFWLVIDEIRNVSAWVENSREIPALPPEVEERPSENHLYDRLRVEMWRMFSQDAPENRSAILKILNLLGPGIGLSRINFYEIQPDQSMICQSEWCAPNQKSSVGLVLPSFIVKPFLSEEFFVCTPPSVMQSLPAIVRPLAKPILWGIYHTYSIETVIACPIKIDNTFEGALMLCIGRDQPDSSQFSRIDGALRSLLEDARQLIGHTMYRLRIEESRRRTQDALRESETKYRNIFESLHDVYYRTDIGGRITLISPSCQQVFGYRPEEMTGRNLLQDLYIKREKRVEFLERIDTDGRVLEFESLMKNKSGAEIWVSTNANYYVDENNNVLGVEGMMRDITERKNLEDQLIRAERMAAVGTLAGGVAHEFNNINLAILGFAELGLMRNGLEEEALHYFRVIRKSALRAKNITSNLLTFAGSTMGRVSSGNVTTVLDDTLQMMKHELSTSGITLEKNYQEVPDTFMDSSQIGQVFLNILINAQHALIDRPEKKITLETSHEGEFVSVSITDTGCGIPPEHIKRIFSPFFTTKGEHAKGDAPMATVRGTGLGLSVSHSIVQNHRGSIELQSRVNEGTTFTVKLPASKTVRKTESTPATRVIEPFVQLKILILDDEEDLRALLSSYLQKQGHVARDTDDGTDALAMLRKERFDLALVDLQMPAMSGREFIDRLAALPRDHRPKLIVVSGHDVPTSLESDLVSAVLTKPFRLAEVASAISAAFLHPHRE
jgi:PAS domain S-box-containing protein